MKDNAFSASRSIIKAILAQSLYALSGQHLTGSAEPELELLDKALNDEAFPIPYVDPKNLAILDETFQMGPTKEVMCSYK